MGPHFEAQLVGDKPIWCCPGPSGKRQSAVMLLNLPSIMLGLQTDLAQAAFPGHLTQLLCRNPAWHPFATQYSSSPGALHTPGLAGKPSGHMSSRQLLVKESKQRRLPLVRGNVCFGRRLMDWRSKKGVCRKWLHSLQPMIHQCTLPESNLAKLNENWHNT